MKLLLKLSRGLMIEEEDMFDNLTNYNLLDDMTLDYTIYKLNHRGYSDWYIWKVWLKGW